MARLHAHDVGRRAGVTTSVPEANDAVDRERATGEDSENDESPVARDERQHAERPEHAEHSGLNQVAARKRSRHYRTKADAGPFGSVHGLAF
jgi:hypothetical protein